MGEAAPLARSFARRLKFMSVFLLHKWAYYYYYYCYYCCKNWLLPVRLFFRKHLGVYKWSCFGTIRFLSRKMCSKYKCIVLYIYWLLPDIYSSSAFRTRQGFRYCLPCVAYSDYAMLQLQAELPVFLIYLGFPYMINMFMVVCSVAADSWAYRTYVLYNKNFRAIVRNFTFTPLTSKVIN